jgi:hypothetical protein
MLSELGNITMNFKYCLNHETLLDNYVTPPSHPVVAVTGYFALSVACTGFAEIGFVLVPELHL